MELPSIYHEYEILQLDVISIKKLQLLVLSSKEEHRIHWKMLLSKHTRYLMKMFQLIIQCGRFKITSTTLKRVMKNRINWFNCDSDLI